MAEVITGTVSLGHLVCYYSDNRYHLKGDFTTGPTQPKNWTLSVMNVAGSTLIGQKTGSGYFSSPVDFDVNLPAALTGITLIRIRVEWFDASDATPGTTYTATSETIDIRSIMATGKIVQLQNKDGEDIYPLAGGTAADSISTNMLENGAVTSDKIDSTTLAAMGSYSTSEVATPFTWIDGKTIYKKTLSIGSLPNNGVRDIAHGISGLDMVIKFVGAGKNANTNGFFPIQLTATDGGNVQVWADLTNLHIRTATDRSSITAYITLYYTKSS